MVAHDESPHQDLRCLQIQLFSSLVEGIPSLDGLCCPGNQTGTYISCFPS